MADEVNEVHERPGRNLYEGLGHTGPLNGEDIVSRFPKGVVAIDKQAGKAWIYDFQRDESKQPVETASGIFHAGDFFCRNEAGIALDDEKRWEAAEGADYDVVVP